MDKINSIIDCIFKENLVSVEDQIHQILLDKINLKLEDKKIEVSSSFLEDRNPTRVKNAQAEKILRKSGYNKIRSGEHQSIWKHAVDSTRELFSLPHHSKELSPGLTRKLFSLATEEVLQDFLSNPEDND